MKLSTETLISAARSDTAPGAATLIEIADRLESHHAALVGIRTAIGMYDMGLAHRIVLATFET